MTATTAGVPRLYPRHNPDAEISVIGAAFLDQHTIDRVELRADELYDPRLQLVWEAMLSLHLTRRPIDVVTVETELGPERLSAIGGLSFLSDCLTIVPSASNAEHYARIVKEDALHRRAVTALAEVLTKAHKGEAVAAELIGLAIQEIQALAAYVPDRTVEIGEAAREAMLELEEALRSKQEGKPVVWGVTTGFSDLDFLLGGLPIGVVTIVAARPSMGKSSFTRSLLLHANTAGHASHAISLEDARRPYALRTIADEARVNLQKLRGLEGLTRGDFTSLMSATAKIMERKHYLVDDTAGLTHAEIAMRVRKHRMRRRALGEDQKPTVVAVDYFTQVRAVRDHRDIRAAHAEVAYGLQKFARDEGIALVIVSQLNRDCEKRPDKRPLLSDLRETGVLEEIADAVLLLYRDEYYTKDECEEPGVVEVNVAKNKHGQTGTLKFTWDAATATVRPLTRRTA